MNQTDKKLINDICQVLDQSIADLDKETKKRLLQARLNALEQPARRFSRRLIWSFASGATALLILGTFLLPLSREQLSVPDGATDLALLTSSDSLELYRHDIEFYFWLSEVMDEKSDAPAMPDSAVNSNHSISG